VGSRIRYGHTQAECADRQLRRNCQHGRCGRALGNLLLRKYLPPQRQPFRRGELQAAIVARANDDDPGEHSLPEFALALQRAEQSRKHRRLDDTQAPAAIPILGLETPNRRALEHPVHRGLTLWGIDRELAYAANKPGGIPDQQPCRWPRGSMAKCPPSSTISRS